MIIQAFANSNPYLKAIAAVRDILLLATGAKEDVKQIYRQVCYAEMSEVYSHMLQRELVDDEYNKGYYTLYEGDPRAVRRYMVNLVYLRILGEKEYCEFYRYEGMVFWLVNIVDSYIELYDYTVEVVQRIVKEAEVLNITVPEKMRKVRL